ncbi:MaoC family dehydratase [Rhodopirellula sp. MGV]|uniref:MaoC family dehydratase n=1 Tax=Rhodopirellula sp. MGV TaxID=2023130 RepID=UPI000B9768B9|nr:MaoC/PaaZ C-terminal domain-containing protein [Rhodopirellula sp. MGV]PNY37466.1 hypothetical protein C2E31_08075 [Rhodopirellula baltica]
MNESELEDLRGTSMTDSVDLQTSPCQTDAESQSDRSSVHVAVEQPLYAEDLSEGDCWETESREITGSDVCQFASLTGDHTPIHGDAADSPFGKPIAHGLLGLSVLAGLGTNHPNAVTLALVSIDEWKFLAPVFFGDRVRGRNEIISIEPHGRRAVKVLWQRSLVNEDDRVVQQGNFVTLVARRKRVTKPR